MGKLAEVLGTFPKGTLLQVLIISYSRGYDTKFLIRWTRGGEIARDVSLGDRPGMLMGDGSEISFRTVPETVYCFLPSLDQRCGKPTYAEEEHSGGFGDNLWSGITIKLSIISIRG